jgi:predicted kinase
MNKEIIVMIGIAGSGKSKFVDDNYSKTHQIVCADDIRMSLGHIFELKIEPLVHSINQIICRAHMIRNLPVVIDETNTRLETIMKWLNLAEEYEYSKIAIMINTPLEICIKRRPLIPKDVLEGMSNNLSHWTIDILNMYFDEVKTII